MVDGKKPPSREGLVGITFWAEPKLRDEVKRLAIDSGNSVQELMREATQDLLANYRDVKRLAVDSGKSVHELMKEATQDLLAKYRKRSRSKA